LKGKLKLISGKRIESPLSQKTRPTTSKVREAIINILGNELEDASWLDLCSGSGAMACEVLQKGVKRILAIEKERKTAKTCKKNLIDVSNSLCHQFHIEVICQEMISFLKKGKQNKKIAFHSDSSNFEKIFDFVFPSLEMKSFLGI
jgi:16S rRNA (guanine(966)-N(2))-methyltransferase RsmD